MRPALRIVVASGNRALATPALAISATSVAEDAASGTVVGELSVVNLGALTVSSYAITADPDSKFAIDGTNLKTAATLDYETATSHSVTIEATLSDASIVSRTFTISVTEVVTPVEVPAITSATWASDSSDTTPDFDIDLPEGVEAGDVLKAEVSVAGADDFSTHFSHTITAQDIIDDAITVYGITPLENGDYEFRFRLERGEEVGAWTSLVEVTIGEEEPTATDIFTATLASNDTGWGDASIRNVVPVTGVTEAYLVVVMDYAAASASRQLTGLGTIPTAGATLLAFAFGTDSYTSSSELGGSFNGQVHNFNRIQVRGSGAGREIRVRFEAPSTGTFAADNVSIGVWDGTTDVDSPYRGSTTATPLELLFSAASGLSISNGATLDSDWLSFPEA